jgi:hypothetical protein
MKLTKDVIWDCQSRLSSNQFITQKRSRIRDVLPSACMYASIEGVCMFSCVIWYFLGFARSRAHACWRV